MNFSQTVARAVDLPTQDWMVMEQKLSEGAGFQMTTVMCFSSQGLAYANVMLLNVGGQLGDNVYKGGLVHVEVLQPLLVPPHVCRTVGSHQSLLASKDPNHCSVIWRCSQSTLKSMTSRRSMALLARWK